MDGLIVKEPFATQLVKGEKTTEYRSTKLPENKTLVKVLILSKGFIKGWVVFSGQQETDDGYEWYVEEAKEFSPYEKYKHKNGCIIWINDVEFNLE